MKLFGYNIKKEESSPENKEIIKEEIKAFSDKGEFKKNLKTIMAQRGEGWENTTDIPGFSNIQVNGFNMFYSTYLNKVFEYELQRIEEYRSMATTPEISDVIEDAVNESTQEDDIGDVFHIDIIDKKLQDNENVVNNIKTEFNNLFKEKLNLKDKIWDIFWTFYIDGRVYYEKVIDVNDSKKGIINIKKLPTETMDFFYDSLSGKVVGFIQYTKPKCRKPLTLKEARDGDGKDWIFFDPNQIGFIDYGIYGKSRYEILGYLEKARLPFNQLKLLETAVIIMRIVRAPERYVFRIDTGNMPQEKALRYVEKIKNKMQKKQSYDPKSGRLTHEPDIMCIRRNTEIPLLDGRYLTLEDIINEFNKGKDNWVYTINQNTLNVEPGKIVNAKITRKNEKLIRIHLDDGNYIDTTYDHKFILRDGSECKADELEVGKSLMPLYKKNKKMENSNLHVEKIEYLNERDNTGCIEVEGNHNFAVSRNSQPLVFIRNSILENFYLPQSAEGRGSSVDTIGGNTAQFSELDDVYYFQKKLYKSLKYPSSRVSAVQENRSADSLFGGSQTSEISRDEVKWSQFLEKQQGKICNNLTDMFLLHMEFKGLKKQYNLTNKKIRIHMNPPSKYKEQMEQMFNDSRFSNYQQLADRPEMSKTYLMRRYLRWDNEEIKANADARAEDIKYGFAEEEKGF